MDCPKCHQATSPSPGSPDCPLCGFDLGPFQQRLRILYVISSALFLSVLVYAGIVYMFERQGNFMPPTRPLSPVLAYTLLGLGVIMAGAAGHILRKRIPTSPSTGALQTLMLIRLTLAESNAIYGLVLYLLSRSIEWFVTLLALSLLTFLFIAASMPQAVRRLGELAVEES